MSRDVYEANSNLEQAGRHTGGQNHILSPETDAIDQFLDQTMVTFLYSEIDERIQFLFKESFGYRQTFCFLSYSKCES